LTVRFDQELELGGRRRLRTEAADAAVAVAHASVDDAERRLRLEVQRTYFEAVLARANRDAAQAALDEITQVIELSEARVRTGEAAGAELRRLQVERLRFVDDLFTDELAYRNTRSALLALMGVEDLSQAFDVAAPLAAPPDARNRFAIEASAQLTTRVPPGLHEQAANTRADLLAARRDVQRLNTETRLQQALRNPNPTVGGGYRRDMGTNAVVFGVTIPLQVFNRNQGGIARADAERRQAEARAEATELGVRLDVQRAANAVAINRARVDYIEQEYLANARESRDIVLASFRLGAADLIDFLDAQRAFRDVQRTYNRALFDERLSLFALEAAVGGPTAPAGAPRNQE
jgi:cobalt-zinc-cadmium efflux system outer membrane protein